MLKETKSRKHPCGVGLILVSRIAPRLAPRVAPVSGSAGAGSRGRLVVGAQVIPCRLGRAGTARDKREGDGATPVGTWRALALMQRRDRWPRLRAGLPFRAIGPRDGWCDDPRVPAYNRPVALPCRASHEAMWRADRLYDAVVVLDYNIRYPRPGRGSAIFFHVAEDRPTAGCIAIDPAAMRRLLPRLTRRSRFKVLP